MSQFKQYRHLILVIMSLCIVRCGINEDDNGSSNRIQKPLSPSLNLSNAFGLAVVNTNDSAALALVKEHNQLVDDLKLTGAKKFTVKKSSLGLTNSNSAIYLDDQPFYFPTKQSLGLTQDDSDSTACNLVNMQESGDFSCVFETLQEIKDAFEQENPNMNYPGPLPSVKTIAKSPDGKLYLHFDNHFIFKEFQDSDNGWDPQNGYQCQIFRVKDGADPSNPELSNLECLDNQHRIDNWRSEEMRESVFQFDNEGNIYYLASMYNSSKTLVYKKLPLETYEDNATEMINAYICLRDFLITPSSGLFYIGRTCDQSGHEGSYFRYISPDSKVIEIARDWWDFTFDTKESTGEDNIVTDKAVFYGPDPRISTTASWDTACLFEFDPTAGNTPETQISEVITCSSNIWKWLELDRPDDIRNYGYGYHNYSGPEQNFSPSLEWKKEYQRRCESDDQVFAGGGSEISAIKQHDNDIYIIGNLRKKIKGKHTCSIEIRGPHCTQNGIPSLLDKNDVAFTKDNCEEESGTWVENGDCSWGANDIKACLGIENTWTPSEREQGTCTATIDGVETVLSDYRNQTDCLQDSRWNDATDTCMVVENNVVGSKEVGKCIDNAKDANACIADNDSHLENNRCVLSNITTAAACNGENQVWEYNYTDKASCNDASSRRWHTHSKYYENVTGELCITKETGDLSDFWDHNNKNNAYSRYGDDNSLSYYERKEDGTIKAGPISQYNPQFVVRNFRCTPLSATSSGDSWTEENRSLAKVNIATKSLDIISEPFEKALRVWVVGDNVIYSSRDSQQGAYLLNTLSTSGACINYSLSKTECEANQETFSFNNRVCQYKDITTEAACKESSDGTWKIALSVENIQQFEAYNVSETATDANKMMISGLDFSDNSYKTGTISLGTLNESVDLQSNITGIVESTLILKNTPTE